MSTEKEGRNVAPFTQKSIRIAPEVDSLIVTSLRIELNHLGGAKTNLQTPMEAETTEEKVHLAIVNAGAKAEDSLDFGQTSLTILLEQAIFRGYSRVPRTDSRHISNRFL